MTKTFVVLGMGRSATSLVAKGLQEAGVYMGCGFLDSDKNNPWGFYEDKEFHDLDQDIFIAAGAQHEKDPWYDPPSVDKILAVRSKFEDRIRALVGRRNREHKFWGWKNPRTALTVWLYHDYLTNPHYIPVFRNCLQVAKSIDRVSGIGIEKGLALYEIYNGIVIDFLDSFTEEKACAPDDPPDPNLTPPGDVCPSCGHQKSECRQRPDCHVAQLSEEVERLRGLLAKCGERFS